MLACSPDNFLRPPRRDKTTATRMLTLNITFPSRAFIFRSLRTNRTSNRKKARKVEVSMLSGPPKLGVGACFINPKDCSTVGICAAIRVIGVEAPKLWFPKRFSFDTPLSEAEHFWGHLLSLEVPTRCGWLRSL